MTLGLLRANGFEAGTATATITAGNSGGGADTGFQLVTVNGTATATYDAAQSLTGSQSLRVNVTSTADVVRLDYNGLTDSSGAAHLALRLNAVPVLVAVAAVQDAAAATICRVYVNSAGKITMTDAAGTTVKTFATALATATWYRVGFRVVVGTTTSNGTLELAYYAGNSTSPVETAFLSTAANTGIVAIGECRFVKVTSAGTIDGWVDQVAYLPGATALIGPPPYLVTVPPPRAAASATLPVPTVSGQLTVNGTGPATATARFPAPVVSGQSILGLIVTVEADNIPPRVRIEITNAGGPSIYVTRTGTDGIPVPVREGDPAPAVSGQVIIYDYEAPFNQPVTYTAGTLTDGPVTLPAALPWLIHPGIPSLSQQIRLIGPLSDETMTSTVGVHDIIGRASPIIVTDGVRKSANFTIGVLTFTVPQSDAFGQLIADTAPLLLQVVYPEATTDQMYRWVSVGDATMSRLGPFGDPRRIWSVPCTQIDRPVGGIQAERTYADLLTEADTYAHLLGLYATYRGVLVGEAGT